MIYPPDGVIISHNLAEYELIRVGHVTIPFHTHQGLHMYVNEHCPPGGFLEALLSNDLVGACQEADRLNQKYIFNIVQVVHHYIPSTCWGSPDRVAEWLDRSPSQI
jgi:hypothetical protein